MPLDPNDKQNINRIFRDLHKRIDSLTERLTKAENDLRELRNR